ncbi:toll-like receptor 13 [Eleutherodactylus coqui]|uniref:toll-like receptor 13 n=1 Tax=Eleutherodactylus coqui TaxID=57060 RepID=UPI003461BBED
MDSTFCLLFLAFFVSSYSPCLGVLRKHCDIMEHEYFQTYSTRMAWTFCGFDELNFSLAAVCKFYNTSITEDLKEVPVASDWLFLDIFNVNITPQALSHLPNLSYIYISGNFVISPVVFHGLEKLTVLWLEQTDNQTIDELDLGGLNMLQELKLKGFPFSSLKKSIFDDLHLLKHLILEDNFIETLSSLTQYLPKLQNLQGLSLYSSNQIALREADCLLNENPTGNMSPIHFNITYLNIDGDQIYILENNSLCNFPKLSFFKPNICYSALKALKKSGIQEVDSFSFSDSHFSAFHICIYVSLFQIKELQLTHNYITFIHTSNGSCSILKILDLSYNSIKNVSASQMKKFKNLQELNLSNNKITTINICSENISMELVNLNLTFNYLTTVIQDQFLCLKQLKTLSLSNNKIQKISKYSFRGMKNLEVLHLESNHLYSLDEFAFAGLFSLKQLTLNENVLEEINDWAFEDLRKLEEIAIDVKYLMPMWWSKKMMMLKRMSLKALDDVLSIEPRFFNLFDDFESLSIESQAVFIDMCDEFPFHKVKELSLINIHDFACSKGGFQAPLGKFINVEKIYLKVEVFVQSKVNIFNSSLENLRKLSLFHLESVNEAGGGSALDVHKLFLGLENLQVLHLVNLRVEDYGSNVLFRDLKSVRFLMIENENIYRFPDNVLSDTVSLKYFFLPNTQFSCQCNLSWLSQWVTYEKQIYFPGFYHQLCFVNAETQNSYLVSFLEENCNTEHGFITFIITFVCTLIFMCISLFYESIWWYSLYLLYTIQCWLYNRQRKRDRYEYDVFVSYNTHNEQWVTERLLPKLEQNGPPFFKVCIHNRDFEIGRDIVENIVDSIYSSRWTICVITRSYLQSNWCSLEIRMATYRLVAESKDSLILIFLDDIPREELQHYHKLTRIIDKKTYLKWPEDRDGQQLFWARLRKVLAYQDNQKP